MPHLPKSKQRPWVPKRPDRSKGLKPQSRSADEHVQFYNSKRWRSLRNYFIQMNPLCVEHEKLGFVVAGTDVDHITPMRLGGSPTSLSNLQTLCKECHARKSGRESRIPTRK